MRVRFVVPTSTSRQPDCERITGPRTPPPIPTSSPRLTTAAPPDPSAARASSVAPAQLLTAWAASAPNSSQRSGSTAALRCPRRPVPRSISRFEYPEATSTTRAMASSWRGALPRLVWSTTPVAFSTRRSLGAVSRWARASTSASGTSSPAAAAPVRIRSRAAAIAWRADTFTTVRPTRPARARIAGRASTSSTLGNSRRRGLPSSMEGKVIERRGAAPLRRSGVGRSRGQDAAAFLLRRQKLLLDLWRASATAAVEVLVGREAAQAALHVPPGLIERDLLHEHVERKGLALGKPRGDRSGTRVVRGEGERRMLEARVQFPEVGAADADAHLRIEELGRHEPVQLQAAGDLARGARHHLGETQRSGRGQRARIEGALLAHERLEKVRRHRRDLRRLGDLLAEGERIGEACGAQRERRGGMAQEPAQLDAHDGVRVAQVSRAGGEIGEQHERLFSSARGRAQGRPVHREQLARGFLLHAEPEQLQGGEEMRISRERPGVQRTALAQTGCDVLRLGLVDGAGAVRIELGEPAAGEEAVVRERALLDEPDQIGAGGLAGGGAARFGVRRIGLQQSASAPVASALFFRAAGIGVGPELVEMDETLARIPFREVRPEEAEERLAAQVAVEMVIDDVRERLALAGEIAAAAADCGLREHGVVREVRLREIAVQRFPERSRLGLSEDGVDLREKIEATGAQIRIGAAEDDRRERGLRLLVLVLLAQRAPLRVLRAASEAVGRIGRDASDLLRSRLVLDRHPGRSEERERGLEERRGRLIAGAPARAQRRKVEPRKLVEGFPVAVRL